MKEIIKCRRCKREQKGEDWKGLRTCPICHEKDRGDSRVRSAERNLDHTNAKLVESLKFTEPLPEMLRNFSEYQKHWREFGQEVKFEDYKKELNDHKKREIQKQADTQIAKTKGEFTAKKRFLTKFIRFDIWEPSNREECAKFRLQKLGLWHEEPNWLDEHLELCEGCGDWLYNLMESNEQNPLLLSTDELAVFLAYRNDFPTEESFRKKLKEINAVFYTVDEKLKKITVVCNPNSAPIENQYEFPEDHLALCCPICGTNLIDGKCPNCETRPYEN
jgi:hypothetical protein